MPRTSIVLSVCTALLALSGVASAQCVNSKILPTSPVAQEFNFEVGDISGDRVVLGRRSVDFPGQIDQGEVQFFHKVGLNWVSDGTVTGSDSGGGDDFGTAVSIKSERAAVGAPFYLISGQPGTSHGAAYIFDWFFFGGWTQMQRLTDPSPVSGERFGSAIAVDANWVVVGAPFKTLSGINFTGAACFYENVSGTWTFRQQFAVPSGAGNSDNFGAAVDMSGTVAIVGAPRRTVSGTSDAGTAYIYRRSGATWSLQSTLLPQVAANSEEFGGSVSTIGDLVAVGARLSTVGTNTSAGNVTIFRFSAGSWVREQTIPNPTPASVSFFGSSVALSGNRLIVSASSPETVYVYTESGGVWTLTDTIEDPDGGFSQFGYFLAADGHNTLICDPADDTLVANNGAAYVFTADENGNDSCNSPRSVGFGSLIGCNIDATTDGVSGGCGESGKDVWYSLLVPCTGRYQIDTEGSTFDTVLSLYEGVNCPGNFVECDDDDGAGSTSLIDRNLVKGQYIKIRVAGYDFGGGDVRNGTFVLNVTPLAPFNDNCANAADITDGSTPYGTCNATTDGFAENLCNFSGDNQVNNDIWFTYRPLCTSQITISNCGTTDYDSKIAVYADSDCPSAAENPIACDDDACFDHASRVVVNVTVNHTIKIRVGGFSTSTGSGVLTITPAPICPGDTDGVSPVGIGDIAVIIQNWNSDVIGCAEGDPSGNGHVGLEDVAVIIQNWGHACP